VGNLVEVKAKIKAKKLAEIAPIKINTRLL